MNSGPEGKIFINYRRDDSHGVAGRLGDSLGAYFGEGRVFRDTEGIEVGADFVNMLDETIGSADAVIVLIGRDWLTMTDESGKRRLDDPNDWVSREIQAALQRKLPVFPVLIEDSEMPRAEDLPEVLKPLVRYNAISISDSRWDSDVTRLAKALAFDIPGSAAERKLDLVRLLATIPLFVCVSATAGLLAWSSARVDWDTLELKTPLTLAQAGVSFVAIILSSVLLLVFANLVDPSRRVYMHWGGAIGLVGAVRHLRTREAAGCERRAVRDLLRFDDRCDGHARLHESRRVQTEVTGVKAFR